MLAGRLCCEWSVSQAPGSSSPAISQQIRALEKELGEPLFERLPRQVVLTSDGAALLPHACTCLAAAAAAALEFADRSGLLGGSFALGTVGPRCARSPL
ncbi:MULTISPECIES: LysR family transcriptional regulator [unclassified Streptomyces]|uniref:LysR family transcriptional regulator n=1 Tax=unclassified Streptomyces TaxID=2593676 RepID=UPI002F9147BF